MDAIPVSPPATLDPLVDPAEQPEKERISWRFPIGCALFAIALVAGAHHVAPPPELPDGTRPSLGPDPFAGINEASFGDTPSLISLPSPVAALPKPGARVTAGTPTISGRLPPEVVTRILRSNQGRFRNCYENGLRTNPNLTGRVAVRFVIGRDGGVAMVQNAGSDLPDGSVVSCVMRAVNGLSFPQPAGGIVAVSHTLRFSPS